MVNVITSLTNFSINTPEHPTFLTSYQVTKLPNYHNLHLKLSNTALANMSQKLKIVFGSMTFGKKSECDALYRQL